MKGIFSSPKTTWSAILAFISLLSFQVGLLFDADPSTMPDWGLIVTQLIAFVGLLNARDNDRSSEDIGIQKDEEDNAGTNGTSTRLSPQQ